MNNVTAISAATNPHPIRVARHKAKLTQSELAARIGVTKATISGWEQGHYVPGARKAIALTQALPGLAFERIYSHARAA